MARETDGIYFLYDDDRLAGTQYDPALLRRYMANYQMEAGYAQEIGRSSFRRALMQVVDEGERLWNDEGSLPGWIHHDTWQRDLEHHQKCANAFIAFSRKAIPMLQAVEDERETETEPRWRAAYDLTYARLLLARLRCAELNWSADNFSRRPFVLQHPAQSNGWYCCLKEGFNVGRPPGRHASAAETTEDSEDTRPQERIAAQAMLEKALYHFQRTIKEHAGTPFAIAARHESSRRTAVDWCEGHDPDYHDGRVTEWQQARKRAPKR